MEIVNIPFDESRNMFEPLLSFIDDQIIFVYAGMENKDCWHYNATGDSWSSFSTAHHIHYNQPGSFFYIMASAGLYSLIYINNSQS